MMKRTLKCILIITFLLNATAAFAAAKVEMINGMVPEGWILVYYALGDINKDGKSDAIMVVENTDRSYLKRNTLTGPKVLNMNPRKMMVLFQTATNYKEVLRVGNSFPTENSPDKPCLADPLVEAGEIKIKDGDIKVALNYKSKCSKFDATEHTFNFHYENARFRLVGFDEMKLERITGNARQYSIDYVAGQQKTVTGINIYEKTKKRTKFESLKLSTPLYLDEISLACAPNNQIACSEKINQAQLSDL